MNSKTLKGYFSFENASNQNSESTNMTDGDVNSDLNNKKECDVKLKPSPQGFYMNFN